MKTDSYWPNELCEKNIYKYSDTVYRLAYALVKNRHDADDIHQEVFVRYITNHVQFKNGEHERAWFLRVTINCCKNYWKRAWVKRVIPLTEEENLVAESAGEKYPELIETVKALPYKYRIVIHLYYFEDLSIEEISQLIKVKTSTVRTQLTRARALLKKKLKEEE